jgi:hypothetical protein
VFATGFTHEPLSMSNLRISSRIFALASSFARFSRAAFLSSRLYCYLTPAIATSF